MSQHIFPEEAINTKTASQIKTEEDMDQNRCSSAKHYKKNSVHEDVWSEESDDEGILKHRHIFYYKKLNFIKSR